MNYPSINLEIFPKSEGPMAAFTKDLVLSTAEITCCLGSCQGEGRRSLAASIAVSEIRVTSHDFKDWERQKVEEMVKIRLLRQAKYSHIRFRGYVRRAGDSDEKLIICGSVRVLGRSKRLLIPLKRERDTWRGSFSIRQTEIGISPVSSLGGALRSRDTVECTLTIATENFFDC